MSAERKLGSSSPGETHISITEGDRTSCTVDVEGLYTSLEHANPLPYVPAGYEFASKTLSSTGDGMGRLSINCIKYNAGQSSGWSAERETVRIDMCETQLDLITHSHFDSSRNIIRMWLNTDEAKRGPDKNGKFYYATTSNAGDERDGDSANSDAITLTEITDQAALDFCTTYSKGITTYIRFDPVIEKISTWKNPPGLTRVGKSFASGSPTFSGDVGKWSTPPITLNGYPASNFFKSKDSWSENANNTWQRTEQWTYTPDGPSSSTGFIYAVATQSNSNANS